jgi:hypothetical protein
MISERLTGAQLHFQRQLGAPSHSLRETATASHERTAQPRSNRDLRWRRWASPEPCPEKSTI